MLGLTILGLSGCLEERKLIWSPDGTRAAVIVPGSGLRLTDAKGTITPVLVPDAIDLAWAPDSRSAAVILRHSFASWKEALPSVPEAEARQVEREAGKTWERLQSGADWKKLSGEIAGFPNVQVCLRDAHAAEIKARFPDVWKSVQNSTVNLHTLVSGALTDLGIDLPVTLRRGLGEIGQIRISPSGGVLVYEYGSPFTDDPSQGVGMFVAPLQGATGASIVDRVASGRDWTPDGRSLVYARAAGDYDDHAPNHLGEIVVREVIDGKGAIAVSKEARSLAGIVLDSNVRVRCLRDGRILFNAVEVCFPLSASDFGSQREQLFALDPDRVSTLIRLIPRWAEAGSAESQESFEPSPDGRQVLFSGEKGEVDLLTISTGKWEQVQAASKNEGGVTPCWKRDGEFTYAKRAEEGTPAAKERPLEIVVRAGKNETILSSGWSDSLLQSFVK
jgi:hypothetical protein